ncbi:BON1-associated protein [Actinidia chinensis var. chinensis]|uniref:BON1-associated protein n=1 Tax=Actinidia chinensis var. chinensis TaxID=1590841 RepID=A0A2R6QS68_ACTCC|nr:BON1-associated protein [Actinidia chinensis var. chinensis]
MATNSRALEVTVISGEGLQLERQRPVKKNAFAVVRTNSRISRTTKTDINGGGYPTWNEKIVVEFPSHARFLTVEVHCKTYSGEKVVGAARIPATDFAGGYFPENYLHILSYRLRDGKGERNGIINLSVRVKVLENTVSVTAAACGGGTTPCLRPWMGVPVAGEGCSSEVVTGVPVWHI